MMNATPKIRLVATTRTVARSPERSAKTVLARAAVFSALAMVATTASGTESATTMHELSPMEQAAHEVLDAHCARCHQDGALKESLDRPQGKFGYVLDLDRMVKKRLVIPGNASASTVLRQIENGSMPKDMSSDCYLFPTPEDAYCGPSADDVKALRVWVDSLQNPDVAVGEATAIPAEGTEGGAPGEAATTDETPVVDAGVVTETEHEPERTFITDAAVIKAMALDIAGVPEARRATQRYFTLTHLRNAGDEDQALKVYGQAVAKLLNSLSRKPDPVKPVFVDAEQTIVRVDIQDLGWSTQTWDLIARANPYFVQYDDALFESLQQQTRTIMPAVRADWFTFVGTQPPLYYDLLGLPDTKQQLERVLGIDTHANIERLDVDRAGFRRSGVSTNNRLIERHEMATGAYWESFDFAGNAGVQDFFTRPLGPASAFPKFSSDYHFEADGGEIIFELPNGFHAYYLTDAAGARLDKGPTEIVRDDSRRDASVTNGVSCMGCHNEGIKYNPHRPAEAHDEIRDLVLGNFAMPKQVRDTVREIFPPHERFAAIMKSDAERFERSLARAGVDMRLTYDGMEMINALYARFEEDITADLAAAEFGLSKEVMFERLTMAGGTAYTLKLRLMQDRIPRDQFVKDYAHLANLVTDNTAVSFKDASTAALDALSQSTARPPTASKTFDLAFVPTSETFIVGNDISFTIRAAKPCYLTLLNVDGKGRTQVVFPNKFNQENALEADRVYTIPSKDVGGFKVGFAEAGIEKVIAICNASRRDPRGISHDFDASAYTDLGDLDALTGARLLSVRQDGSHGGGTASSTAAPLVENSIDPKVDIVAQKAIVMNVKAH